MGSGGDGKKHRHGLAQGRGGRWKYDGPFDSFKALIEMAAVHSSCNLCIHIATKIHEKEERTPKFMNCLCSCSRKKGAVYHLLSPSQYIGHISFQILSQNIGHQINLVPNLPNLPLHCVS